MLKQMLIIVAAFVTTAAAPPSLPPGTPAFASLKGDPVAGKLAFSVCAMCHSVVAGQIRMGPSLHGIVGRPSASAPGFLYSPANAGLGITWTAPLLYQYLLAPQAFVPGTRMGYAGMKDAQKRADVIAYLASRPAS